MANDPHFFSGSAPAGESSTEFTLAPGLLLGNKYRLLRPAGFGGMGAVWVARNEATAAEVAVKVLVTAREGVDQEAIARFRREAHTAAQLYHRGIVRIFDLVELHLPREDESAVRHATRGDRADSAVAPPPDALVLVMELLRGETLASQMDKKIRFSQEETLAIVLPLLSALAHAHAQGIVHRDLKPENVFLSVDPDGHVIPKILDFGISKLLQPAAPRITTDGAMLGTPSYMSPEQARGLPNVDARADVFAAGILLYECMAGENPFASASYHSVVAAILERDPLPLKAASPEVWRVIRRALEKPPALRYADADELGNALIAAAQAENVPTPESSGAFSAQAAIGEGSVPPAPFREPGLTIPSIHVGAKRRRRSRATIGAFAVALSLAAGTGFYTRSTRLPARASGTGSAPSPPSPALSHAVPVAGADSSGLAPAAIPPASALSSEPPASPAGGASALPEFAPPIPTVSARPHASPHAPPPVHPKGLSPPAPSAAPAPASPAPHSSVVRDPGF